MSSELTNYLASKYLVADPAKSIRKRKRKSTSKHAGLIIMEDIEWEPKSSTVSADIDTEDVPEPALSSSAEFRKSRSHNWRSIKTSKTVEADGNSATANKILASAAADRQSSLAGNDELPVVECVQNVVTMGDGTHAGLQTVADVTAQLKRRRREEHEQFERHRSSGKEEETVYRDATGRRIDVTMTRALARKAAADAEDNNKSIKKSLRGKTQLEQTRWQTEQLQAAKFLPFARSVEDEEMNKDLKAQGRWNDPLLQFGAAGTNNLSKKKQDTGHRPSYAGAAPLNRYGIRPGYRWDGVDRGIGFETKRFKALNRRDRLKSLDYSWQMDE